MQLTWNVAQIFIKKERGSVVGGSRTKQAIRLCFKDQ